ncbi:MAG: hypothetical protein FJZ59_06735 [Chlamydiae bacterium]|nr:hypothetical protein [Chlamydiota bacterium]
MKKIVYFTLLSLSIFAENRNEFEDVLTSEVSEITEPSEENSKPLSLSIVQGDGSVVSLSDGSLYQIDPHHWDVSSGWIANPAEVSIEDTKDGSTYPLIITNKATGNYVRATLAPQQELSSE